MSQHFYYFHGHRLTILLLARFPRLRASAANQAVRGEVHAAVRKAMVDWLLSEDHPRDIKIYVTGHSMGGALGTHCAMDLKVVGRDERAVLIPPGDGSRGGSAGWGCRLFRVSARLFRARSDERVRSGAVCDASGCLLFRSALLDSPMHVHDMPWSVYSAVF